jgi:hypothetical protein
MPLWARQRSPGPTPTLNAATVGYTVAPLASTVVQGVHQYVRLEDSTFALVYSTV